MTKSSFINKKKVSYYLSMLHSEYNSILNEETFLGFGDNTERLGGVKKDLLDELDALFNIYDDEGELLINF